MKLVTVAELIAAIEREYTQIPRFFFVMCAIPLLSIVSSFRTRMDVSL